ncbi:MAG: hypothetical protein FWE21_07740 [Defluviitaleaceae bacterium]|nr:hypothetical protein [Defluviitaleaceae bacterium]
MKRLDFQQERGYMSSLPLRYNGIVIQRGLTTSSTAIFIPFMTQELRMSGQSIYYGIENLDTRRQVLIKTIAEMTADAVSPEHMKRLSNHLENWDSTDFEDRRLVVDGLISQIRATSESVQIEWKI